jgi:hypothetical protein
MALQDQMLLVYLSTLVLSSQQRHGPHTQAHNHLSSVQPHTFLILQGRNGGPYELHDAGSSSSPKRQCILCTFEVGAHMHILDLDHSSVIQRSLSFLHINPLVHPLRCPGCFVKTSPAPPLQQNRSFRWRWATAPPSSATAASLAERRHHHNRPPPLPSLPYNGDSWLLLTGDAPRPKPVRSNMGHRSVLAGGMQLANGNIFNPFHLVCQKWRMNR